MNEDKIIGINSLFLIPGKVGGTEIFLRNQILELAKIKTKTKFVIYANKENSKIFNGLPNNFKVVNTGIRATNRFKRIFWEQVVLPLRVYIDKIDVLHSPGYTSSVLAPCKKITTIFDLNYYFHPEDFGLLERVVYSILIPLSAYTSERIIVHSNASKSEIKRVFDIKDEKIVTIYPGVAEEFKININYKESKSFVNRFNISTPFILANSTSHPHKNLINLILAFSMLVKDSECKHNLVLIGIQGREFKNINELIGNLDLRSRVKFTNKWLKNTETKHFYRVADIFVQPSLYEGFGLPLVEAMAVGVPLVASKYSCIPEIVGNAGLIVDTKKPRMIAGAILSLLKSKLKRDTLTKLGRRRAKTFSWNQFGKSVYNLYLNV